MPPRTVLDTPLVRYLAARGIAHAWLARQLGVTPAQFHFIEQGRTDPGPGYYDRAAAILGCDAGLIRRPAPPPRRKRRRRRQPAPPTNAAA